MSASSQYYRVTSRVGVPHRHSVEVTLPLVGPVGPAGPAGAGLEALQVQGDTFYRGASTGERLPIGSAGQVLKVVNGLPAWSNESGAVTSVNGQTGSVVLDAEDVGALQTAFSHETYSYSGGGGTNIETLPARRNARWDIVFIVSGGTRTIILPTADVQVGDRIYLSLASPSNTTVVLRRPMPGAPDTIATIGGGQRIFYAATCTRIISSQPMWISSSEMSALFGVVPSTSTSSGAAGTFSFGNDAMYVCVATDTWRRVPIAAF